MVVMLNGINISDAQTGHHNMDLPVDVSMVERVELLTPSQMMARGVVAFSGGVNIVVCEEYRERLLAEVSGGNYGTANAALLATWRAGQWALTAAGSYHRSDGYMHNADYNHGSLFLQAHRHAERDDWQLQVGGQMKGFGGAGFYSTTYPDQYEATRTLVASAYNVHRWRTARLETALYGRLHGDRFELFRDGMVDAPAWYTGHNHHIGSTAGVRSRATVQWGRGELLGGVDVRREGIRSNVLGEPDSTLAAPYTKAASRTGLSLFGGYHLAAGRWDAQAVALGLYNTRFGLNYGAYLQGAVVHRFILSECQPACQCRPRCREQPQRRGWRRGAWQGSVGGVDGLLPQWQRHHRLGAQARRRGVVFDEPHPCGRCGRGCYGRSESRHHDAERSLLVVPRDAGCR